MNKVIDDLWIEFARDDSKEPVATDGSEWKGNYDRRIRQREDTSDSVGPAADSQSGQTTAPLKSTTAGDNQNPDTAQDDLSVCE